MFTEVVGRRWSTIHYEKFQMMALEEAIIMLSRTRRRRRCERDPHVICIERDVRRPLFPAQFIVFPISETEITSI